ncbi:3-hydroxybenzoate 6-monooxygenase [Primorskyibacter sp. S87]|uniref:3-hydroxybenzoate 6-monooxygenase n=1 Tax=Primorskyibacter sp. S87 TaxID=3415126 RepID=UPI003C7CBE66
MPNRVLIAGGGIGGLAAAIGLARQGWSVLVLEKLEKFGEIGAGIQLGPNAFHAFDRLGVGGTARKMAVFIDNLRLMDAISGDEITRIPLGEEFRLHMGNPYAVVHRGEMHGILLEACQAHPRIELWTNSQVVEYTHLPDGIVAHLSDGRQVQGSILIGADGLWSRVRRQMLADGPPRVSGHTTYRSVIPVGEMPEDLRWNAATLWAGPKCHIVHYPLSGWKLFNLVVTYHNDAPEPVAGLPVGHDEVLKGFEHVHPVARQVIERGQGWKLWVLCDREPVMKWTDGPVGLLGDAAHPMLQYFAQGACMAVEDAVCLSDALSDPKADPGSALLAYQNARALRTARVQLQSREIGNHIYHPEGAHAALRNQIMRSKSPQDWYEALGWLYGKLST